MSALSSCISQLGARLAVKRWSPVEHSWRVTVRLGTLPSKTPRSRQSPRNLRGTELSPSQPGSLAERLVRMRVAAGLNGDQLAARLAARFGWAKKTAPPKVS